MSRKHFRLLPHPALSLALLLLWLLLNNSIAIGQLFLGAILALLVPLLMPARESPRLVLKRPWGLIAYIGLVFVDIVKANFTVARQVLGENSDLKSGFLDIPLTVTHPVVISLFASTITLTPGTVSCEVSEDRRFLRVHALHAEDPSAEIFAMKQRYEARLARIFAPEVPNSGANPRSK